MLKAILVEDNPREKRTVSNTFNKLDLDIELAETFDNGADALNYLRLNKTDILISDIQMPVLNGIELLNALRQENIKIKSILISCYDYFDYAQSAINLDVIAYVLKPILNDELEKAITVAYNKCLSEKEDELYQKQLQNQVSKIKYILQEQFLRNLLFSHSIDINEITTNEKIIDLKIASGYKVVAAFKLSKTNDTKCDLFTINCAIVDYIISLKADEVSYYPYILSEDTFTIVFCFPSPLFDTVKTILSLKDYIETNFFIKLIVGISNGDTDAAALNTLYIQAKETLDKAIGNTKNFVIMYDEINTEQTPLDVMHIQTEIREILSDADIDFSSQDNAVKKFLKKYLMRHNLYSTNYIHAFTFCVINMLEITLSEYGKSLEDTLSIKLIFDKLAEFDTIQNLYFWLENIIRASIELVQQNSENKHSRATEMIKDIIANNYKTRLTIDDIAKEIHFSSKQAHRIFLKETGESILDYLTSYRIQKAKEYLGQKDSKLYLVSQQVGYKNKTYFNELFKQHTGFTPQEYKARLENKQ
ncbi:MAG: response regulator [Clostridia bacterium]|nr:response regulator [Clostridia bacterium]